MKNISKLAVNRQKLRAKLPWCGLTEIPKGVSNAYCCVGPISINSKTLVMLFELIRFFSFIFLLSRQLWWRRRLPATIYAQVLRSNFNTVSNLMHNSRTEHNTNCIVRIEYYTFMTNNICLASSSTAAVRTTDWLEQWYHTINKNMTAVTLKDKEINPKNLPAKLLTEI